MGSVRLLVVFAACALVGCSDYAAQQKAEKEYKAKHAALEATEREAHSVQRQWYEVKIGKFDGECADLSRSARTEADSYHSYRTWLANAEKIDDDYLLDYDLGSPHHHKIYVTSISLCERVIELNKTK